jgi:hypothetical protein
MGDVSAPRVLVLSNGVEVEAPVDKALAFFAAYPSSYPFYDSVEPDPYVFGADDIRLANRIIARMGASATAALLGRRSQIESAMRGIRVDATLAAPTDEVPWDAIAQMYAAVDNLPHIGLPRATKALHRKRPALIPILDSVVEEYLVEVGGPAPRALGERGLELTRRYHAEILHCLDELRAARLDLQERGLNLTECRLLDIFLWAYSGTYQPFALESSSRHMGSPHHDPLEVPVAPGIVAFIDDDEGFVGWRDVHPDAYILNCARKPTRAYLKLHRASCGHMHRANVRRWTGAFVKYVAEDGAVLVQWIIDILDTEPDRCASCRP